MTEEKGKERAEHKAGLLGEALLTACSTQFGALSSDFLCKSIGSNDPKEPLTVSETTSVREVIDRLREHRIGSVVVVDGEGKLTGIFTERDCVLKLFNDGTDLDLPITSVMTGEPVSQTMDSTIAYALNLMSHGGFRHLPIVDEGGAPIGMVSVKDVVDHLVEALTRDLLGFDEEQ